MILSQITISENLTYGIITTLGCIVLAMGLFIFKTHSDTTKARLDSRKSEDEAHVKEVNSLKERMIKAETKVQILVEDTKEIKSLLKENYEKLDSKLERILENIDRKR